MKKLLGISLVAVLAATPLMARAEGELASGVQINGGVTVSTAQNGGNALATKSYVQGAYNTVETDIANVNNAVTLLNNNAGTAGSVLHTVKTKAADGDYDATKNYVEGTIGHAIKTTTTNAVEGLDADESQTGAADNGWLNLQVVEENGKITSISGSITADKYDAYGSAAAEQTRAEGVEGDLDDLTTSVKTSLVDAINSEKSRAETAESGLSDRIDAITTANGTIASGHYLDSEDTLGENLTSLDNQIYANETDIDTINNKQIPIITTWGSNDITQKKISELVTYVAPANPTPGVGQ